MKIVGKKLLDVCQDCGQIVRIDKPIFGSLHICTTPEERKDYAAQIRQNYLATKAALERA
jgi:hypothetical protein